MLDIYSNLCRYHHSRRYIANRRTDKVLDFTTKWGCLSPTSILGCETFHIAPAQLSVKRAELGLVCSSHQPAADKPSCSEMSRF
jgi:hypothetical protein